MHPILAQIGPIPIHTYGFLIALGFIIAVQVMQRLAARSGIDPEKMQDLIFGGLLVGFLGARIVFILTRLSYFTENPLDMFKVWEGGLVFYGGPIATVPFIIWFAKKHKFPLWRTFDVIGPGLTIAHAFGRLGCLSAGCCYGKPTGGDWGVVLNSELVDPSMRGIHLHPTQLYESVSLFILTAVLLAVFKRRKFDGQVTLIYFMTYPIIRSIIEIYRGDTIRGFVIGDWLSTSQFISILVFVAAFFVMLYRLKQVHAGDAPTAVMTKAKAR
ncbi:MAG: prolipoprotein diacylglyceryl transferase [Bdellovibrionales bacterium]|nr:prolipoprotein diacylglyceryl transferase [Bdellovibrionales bacterium]